MVPRNSSHSIKEELTGILVFLGVIWAVFAVTEFLAPGLRNYGLRPRATTGLIGLLSMPLLHADWRHIMSNTVPLLVLLCLLAGSKARSWTIVIAVTLLGGALLWVFGRSGSGDSVVHIGASGLVFGLASYLILSGIFERRLIPMVVAVVTFFLYGGTLFTGVQPTDAGVSWDGHLCGAVAGGVIAFATTRNDRKK